MLHSTIFKNLSLGLLLAGSLNAYAVERSCIKDGFLPKNDLKVPVNAYNANSMTEARFNAILDQVERSYSSIVRSKGGKLLLQRNWTDGTVNAYADRDGQGNWIVSMYGGLARHNTITEDGFFLVACHELGHHLGGAPKIGGDWASNEGQSDYFATLKCLRKVWENDNNVDIVAGMIVDPSVQSACEKSFSDKNSISICVRSAYAGLSSANMSFALGSGGSAPNFNNPDPAKVRVTNDKHPQGQCRLDTYFNGSVCQARWSDEVTNSDPVQGTCSMERGDVFGYRPQCWYKPSTITPTPTPTPEPIQVAPQPTIYGLTEVALSPWSYIPIEYDVSRVPGARSFYLEVVGPNGSVQDPNGYTPDPGRIYWTSGYRTRGVVYVNPLWSFPYYGTYLIRVIPLDSSGHYPVAGFSNLTTLYIQ